jgi:hypothetical protein
MNWIEKLQELCTSPEVNRERLTYGYFVRKGLSPSKGIFKIDDIQINPYPDSGAVVIFGDIIFILLHVDEFELMYKGITGKTI